MPPANGTQPDFFDNLVDCAAEVPLRGEVIRLGIPTLPELEEIRKHFKKPAEERNEDWYMEWCAMCLNATVRGYRKRSTDEWTRIILASNLGAGDPSNSSELVLTALKLCGYNIDLPANAVDKIEEADEDIGDLPTTSQPQPDALLEAS